MYLFYPKKVALLLHSSYLNFSLQIPDTDVVRLHWLDAEKELGQVVEHSPGEGVVVLTPGVLQIVVALVVKHLIGRQIHRSIEKLK